MIQETAGGNASELRWFRSSYSDSSTGSECVEVAATRGAVHVRDSKNVRGPGLAVAPAAGAGVVAYAAAH
ncbi:DUF397 domain-containing protein [Streptomyces sp. 43Y-GA-1]|uniref:DUF397 domain-containing protein n=1 Tax=Streptomyces sp. 43Y-GA-1 TaxID=2939435 RepID=UPI0020C09026|nr:DUF397 domain-containing protein [Streptomyces sp. 43Y-GA-1]MCL6290465.1 DUF397 domain-containing protein [Streptomyces sp. 43Y-GA-1]